MRWYSDPHNFYRYAAMEYAFAGKDRMAKKWALEAKESLRMLKGEGHEYHTAMMRILGETPVARPYKVF
jgi:hypothetical protein